MVRLLKQFRSGQKGQALVIVLGLLARGGLTIAVSLNYATTSLNGSRILEEKMEGIYAAGAGVEYALWSVGINGTPAGEVPQQLSENISGMTVSIETLDKGTFTLYSGELFEEAGVHVNWLSVNGTVVFDAGTTANYTITVTRQQDASGNIKLVEVGATLPAGYVYEGGSAASFPENITSDDPSSTGTTTGGAQWLKWEWNPGQGPNISSDNTTQYQKFRITGTANLDGDYAWVVAQSASIGTVGEITGERYVITATATRPGDGRTTAVIVADIVIVGGDIQIMSWQITE